MVENLSSFYKRLINVKDVNNKPLFESWELDQIVTAAQEPQYPAISAKSWAISDSKKNEIFTGKNHDMQY